MGGTNEKKVNGLRMHVSGRDVHVHDDSASLKFHGGTQGFRTDTKDALKNLGKKDGIVLIRGSKGSADLFVGQESGKTFMFLRDSGNVKRELEAFLKVC